MFLLFFHSSQSWHLVSEDALARFAQPDVLLGCDVLLSQVGVEAGEYMLMLSVFQSTPRLRMLCYSIAFGVLFGWKRQENVEELATVLQILLRSPSQVRSSKRGQ